MGRSRCQNPPILASRPTVDSMSKRTAHCESWILQRFLVKRYLVEMFHSLTTSERSEQLPFRAIIDSSTNPLVTRAFAAYPDKYTGRRPTSTGQQRADFNHT